MALTEEASKAVYATAGYEESVQNLSQVSLDADNVFSDGYDLQIPTITGTPPRATSSISAALCELMRGEFDSSSRASANARRRMEERCAKQRFSVRR